MALSKRDQRTLTITIVLLLGYIVWSFGVQPVWNTYTELDESLQTEREKYEHNQETMREEKSINEGYARVEAQFPKDDPDRDPGDVFSEEVVDLVKETVGAVPGYSPPNTQEIKGATGYEFLILALNLRTNLDKAATLLKAFDSKGYLIQSVTITRDSNLNSDELTLELNLGRIVKIRVEEDNSPRPGSLRLNRKGAR